MVQGNSGRMPRSVRGRVLTLLVPGLLGAAGSLAACSAGVDDYFILEDGVRGSGGAASTGGRSGQSGGRFGQGGSGDGGSEPGGAGGEADSGGSGNASGDGGAPGGGGGAPSTGGANDGGTGSGGANTGGANTGGVNTGGVGTGGVSTGGVGTGGVSTGGVGTGGVGTGGTTGFGQPAVVTVAGAPGGITAAAWDGVRYFWLLSPSAKAFYRLDPQTVPPTMAGPFALPGNTIAARVFGVSATHVFIIADGNAYKVPRAGDANAAGVTFGSASEMPELVGAFATGYLLVAHTGGAVNARAFKDDGTLPNVSALGKVSRVATDGTSFVIARVNGTDVDIHRVGAPSFALNTAPCRRGAFTTRSLPISVAYSSVAWAAPGSGSRPRLVVSRLSSGTCESLGAVQFGTSGTTGHALALLDGTHAVVTETFAAGTCTVTVRDAVTSTMTPETNVNLGGTAMPSEIVAGGEHAVIIGGNAPVLVRM